MKQITFDTLGFHQWGEKKTPLTVSPFNRQLAMHVGGLKSASGAFQDHFVKSSPAVVAQVHPKFGITGTDEPLIDTTVDSPFSVDQFLGDLATRSKEAFALVPERISMAAFLKQADQNPKKFLPQAAIYMVGGIEHFGLEMGHYLGKPVTKYKAFDVPWDSGNGGLVKMPAALWGHHDLKAAVVRQLKQFMVSTTPNRAIMLLGPNGSGKTQMAETLGEILEQYSNTPEGVMYTVQLGLPEKLDDTSPVDAKEDGLIDQAKVKNPVISRFNVHPMFLLPKDDRAKLIHRWIDSGKLPKEGNYDYYLKGDLDDPLKGTFEALRRKFQGDYSRIWPFVEVIRWRISKTTAQGLATVPATPTTTVQQKRVAEVDAAHNVAEVVQATDMSVPSGPAVKANRGLLVYDDFGRDPEAAEGAYGSLLYEDQGTVHLPNGGRQKTDHVTLLTANPGELAKVKDIDALMRRVVVMGYPLLRTFRDEMNIYQPYYRQATERGVKLTPNALEAFSLWVVMTRLKEINPEAPIYSHEGVEGEDVQALKLVDDRLRKALYLEQDKEHTPEAYYTTGSLLPIIPANALELARRSTQDRLRKVLPLVADEHKFDPRNWRDTEVGKKCEAMSGIDPRIGQDLMVGFLHDLDANKRSYTVLDLLEHMGAQCCRGIEGDSRSYIDHAMTDAPTEVKPAPASPPKKKLVIDQASLRRINIDFTDEALHRWMLANVAPYLTGKKSGKFPNSWRTKNPEATISHVLSTREERLRRGASELPPGWEDQLRAREGGETAPTSTPRTGMPTIKVGPPPATQFLTYLRQVEDFYRRKLITDLKVSLGMFRPDEEYVKEMNRYMHHVQASMDARKSVVPHEFRIRPDQANADEDYMKSIEAIINPRGISAFDFRSKQILIRLKDFKGDRNQDDNIKAVFGDEMLLLKLSDADNNREKTIDAFTQRCETQGVNWFVRPETGSAFAVRADRELTDSLRGAATKLTAMGPNYPQANLVELIRWGLSSDYICDGSFKRKKAG